MRVPKTVDVPQAISLASSILTPIVLLAPIVIQKSETNGTSGSDNGVVIVPLLTIFKSTLIRCMEQTQVCYLPPLPVCFVVVDFPGTSCFNKCLDFSLCRWCVRVHSIHFKHRLVVLSEWVKHKSLMGKSRRFHCCNWKPLIRKYLDTSPSAGPFCYRDDVLGWIQKK